MQAFLVACAAVIIISIGAMIILDQVVQEPVSSAFATSGVRL